MALPNRNERELKDEEPWLFEYYWWKLEDHLSGCLSSKMTSVTVNCNSEKQIAFAHLFACLIDTRNHFSECSRRG